MGVFTRSLIPIFYGKITMTLKSKIHKWWIRQLLPLHKTLFGKKTLGFVLWSQKKLQNHKNQQSTEFNLPILDTCIYWGMPFSNPVFQWANNMPNDHHVFLVGTQEPLTFMESTGVFQWFFAWEAPIL